MVAIVICTAVQRHDNTRACAELPKMRLGSRFRVYFAGDSSRSSRNRGSELRKITEGTFESLPWHICPCIMRFNALPGYYNGGSDKQACSSHAIISDDGQCALVGMLNCEHINFFMSGIDCQQQHTNGITAAYRMMTAGSSGYDLSGVSLHSVPHRSVRPILTFK